MNHRFLNAIYLNVESNPNSVLVYYYILVAIAAKYHIFVL